MKKIYTYFKEAGILHAIAWFMIVLSIALTFTSCASVHCDAYGDTNTISYEEKT
jgi:hypothetical protein